ncbi:hypothetical protein INO69_13575, partial [Staphylococcus aureus]|nr:hypothetical protein [Staphylococcus aureus]
SELDSYTYSLLSARIAFPSEDFSAENDVSIAHQLKTFLDQYADDSREPRGRFVELFARPRILYPDMFNSLTIKPYMKNIIAEH